MLSAARAGTALTPGVAGSLPAIGRIQRVLNRWPAVGLAIGVVRDGRLALFAGHGLADVRRRTPITEDTVFRIGSITKTLTAIAVMQLWERGLVDLDAPANDYLRTVRLVPASTGFRPATVRHLLTHTAGIGEVRRAADMVRPLFGEIVPAGRPIPSPAEYYRRGLRIRAQPGTRFIYTDHGFAALGQLVEDVTGIGFDRYLREHVFAPLGMTDTDLVRSRRVQARLATGYELRRRGPEPVADYEVVTAGGGGVFSTTRDMAAYVAALLGGGRNEHGSVLAPETLATMFDGSHYQPDGRLPGMGLGFERYDVGRRPIVGHGGILPGFHSQILLAPDEGIGIIGFTNGAARPMLWLPTELAGLLADLIGVPNDTVRTDVAHRPEAWADICGTYRLAGGLTDVRARLITGAGAQVYVSGGKLMLRLLTPVPALVRGLPLHPDDATDPYAFRVDLTSFGLPVARVLFRPDASTGAVALHTSLIPLTLLRHTERSPRRVRAAALGTLGAVAGALALGRTRRSSA